MKGGFWFNILWLAVHLPLLSPLPVSSVWAHDQACGPVSCRPAQWHTPPPGQSRIRKLLKPVYVDQLCSTVHGFSYYIICCVQEMESENQFMQAENHFVLANEWKAAANMYNAHDLWDDAYRVVILTIRVFAFDFFCAYLCVYRWHKCFHVHVQDYTYTVHPIAFIPSLPFSCRLPRLMVDPMLLTRLPFSGPRN